MKKKKKPLTLIRVIRNNKNPPKENRERERERVLTICLWKKYGLMRDNIKFIQNKMDRRRVKM